MMKLQPLQDIKDLSLWGKSFGFVACSIIAYIAIGWGSAWWEILSAVSGVICVVLVAEGKLSNYLWGLVNCTLYGLTSYHNDFYGDMSLNWVIYVPFQFIGFVLWRNALMAKDELPTKSLDLHQALFAFTVLMAAIGIGTLALIKVGGNNPLTDSTNVCLSLLATLLMALRYKEQWLCWIMVNVSGIGLWLNTGEGGEAALLMWCAFLTNSIYGYWKWNKLQQSSLPD